MARTRSTKATPGNSSTSKETRSSTSKYTLPDQSENPSKLFILPSKATQDARIITLPHPRSARPSRYLVCPETGIYEFTKVAAPKTTPRSWLIEKFPSLEETTDNGKLETQAEISMGAELFVATTIDPVFLVLPALADLQASKGSEEQKRLFLTSDDHFDKLPEEASHLNEILRCTETRKLLEARMGAICDTVEAGDESMFRLSEKKLLEVVLGKAKKMIEGGLPPSLEEKFVKKALEAPILIQKRAMVVSEGIPVSESVSSHVSTPRTDSNDSQSTVTSTETSTSLESQTSTAATSVVEEATVTETIVRAIEPTPEVFRLQRIRVAFDFICSNYVALAIATQLTALLAKSETNSIDFSPLDEYLTKLTKLRAEALAARSMGDYSRKHGRDEEEDEARAEKKRKAEEEKKKKSTESRGVRDLKKVNTKGMKKMSDFFKKK